jgi:hypothetical protein
MFFHGHLNMCAEFFIESGIQAPPAKYAGDAAQQSTNDVHSDLRVAPVFTA